MDTAFLISSIVTLFVVIDPIALTPLFITLTQGHSAAERRSIGMPIKCMAFCTLAEASTLGYSPTPSR